MKLILAFSLLKHVLSLDLNSDCVDNNLVITIPLENEKMSSVLKLEAGTCNENNIPGGILNAVTYDEGKKGLEIKIPIEECGLKTDLYEIPLIRAAAAIYRPTANITLGARSGGLEIIFKNLHIAAECGLKTHYQVDFEYNISAEEDEGCHWIDGVCVFPGNINNVRFELIEYTDSDYSTAADENTRKTMPGQTMYMALTADKIPDGYDYAVTQCIVINEDGNEFELINPSEGTCGLAEIDFEGHYEGSNFRMSHILFLLSDLKKASYTLRCFVELCDAENNDSVCKRAVEACTPRTEYQCDAVNWVPEATDVVLGAHSMSYEGLTQIDSLFARSAVGAAFLNKFTSVHNTYDFRSHKTGSCVTCTIDHQNIVPLGGATDWMSASNQDLGFRNCNQEMNYRPLLCTSSAGACGINWEEVTVSDHYSYYCDDTNYVNHAIFVNSDVYARISDSCGPFVAIREAHISGEGSEDGEDNPSA